VDTPESWHTVCLIFGRDILELRVASVARVKLENKNVFDLA